MEIFDNLRLKIKQIFEIAKNIIYYFNPFRDKTMTFNLFFSKFGTLIKERRLPKGFVKLFHKYDSIVVETVSICNAKCVWCWMYYSKRKDMGLMSLENFKIFIDLNYKYLIKNKIKIVPYHRGEPLLHPDFFEMLDYGHKKGIEYSEFHTNLGVNISLEKLIQSPLPHILVNMGGITKDIHEKVMGTSFELVTNNLKELIKLNKANKPIFLKMNVTKQNFHQINELPNFFEQLGGDPKNTIVGKTGFSLPAEASSEEIEIFFENIVSDEIKDYLLFTYDDSHNIRSKEPRCPFMIPTVKWDGKVTICCHDQLNRLNLGNAFELSIKNILNNKKYYIAEKIGKKKGHSFCKECN